MDINRKLAPSQMSCLIKVNHRKCGFRAVSVFKFRNQLCDKIDTRETLSVLEMK